MEWQAEGHRPLDVFETVQFRRRPPGVRADVAGHRDLSHHGAQGNVGRGVGDLRLCLAAGGNQLCRLFHSSPPLGWRGAKAFAGRLPDRFPCPSASR